MSAELENIWYNVTSNMPKPVSEWWWDLLVKKHNESGRNCHDITNLQNRFHEFDQVRDCIKNPQSFSLALFFQYFEYDPKDSDCHTNNIGQFEKFAAEAAILEDETYSQVKDLLEASSIHSTEEHKTDGAYGKDDIHYYLDVDMVMLGATPELYAQYVANVVIEYSFLDSATFRNLRRRVLQSFLLIPNIFATKYFRDKYEGQARENIEKELTNLPSS